MPFDSHQQLVPHLLDIVRGTHLPHEGVDQIAHLLFLKLLNEQDEERRVLGQPCLFEGAAKRFLWEEWCKADGRKMVDVLRDGVFPFLASVVKLEPHVGEYFRSVKMEITHPVALESVVRLISDLRLLLLPPKARGKLFEQLLSELPSSSREGQTFTPDAVRQLMIELAQPHENDTILDPCCGTGVLLAQAAESLTASDSRVAEITIQQQAKRVHGVEIVWAMARLARLNMIFHGHSGSSVSCGNSLSPAGPLSDADLRRGYSLVLASPPFGGREQPENVRADLHTSSRQTELLFLDLSMKALAPGGRAVIVVPDGLLFGSTASHIELRKHLVENHHLMAVISLGSRAFLPQASLKTNILVFRKGSVQSAQTERKIWFYELKTDAMSKKTASAGIPGIEELIAAWNCYANSGFTRLPGEERGVELDQDAPEPAGWWTTLSRVRANAYDLIPLRYKPTHAESLADPVVLQAQLLQRIGELDDAARGWDDSMLTSGLPTQDWPTCRLSDVTLGVPAFDPTSEPESWFSYVEVSNIDRKQHKLTAPKSFQGKGAPSRARRRVQTGDILISTVRPSPGGIAIVTPEMDGAIASNTFCVLRPNPTLLLPEFLLQMVLQRSFTQQLSAAAGGAVMPTVSETVIKNSIVRVPPLVGQHQHVIVQALAQAERIERACEALGATAQSLQDAIRTHAFKSATLSESRATA
jgi:type I restriction enzyme M protein